MSKPDDIPQDVLAGAVKFTPCFAEGDRGCRHVDGNSCQDNCEWADSIARAIMAAELRGEAREREACADIADQMRAERKKLQLDEEKSADCEDDQAAILGGQAFIARCVRDAIRKRGDA